MKPISISPPTGRLANFYDFCASRKRNRLRCGDEPGLGGAGIGRGAGGRGPPARNAIFQLPTNTLMNDNGLLIEGTRAAPRRLTASAPVESPG